MPTSAAPGRDEGTDVVRLRSGSSHCQATRLVAGDYHRACGGREHRDTTTDEGCVIVGVLQTAA